MIPPYFMKMVKEASLTNDDHSHTPTSG